jgi:hypothetical protein
LSSRSFHRSHDCPPRQNDFGHKWLTSGNDRGLA